MYMYCITIHMRICPGVGVGVGAVVSLYLFNSDWAHPARHSAKSFSWNLDGVNQMVIILVRFIYFIIKDYSSNFRQNFDKKSKVILTRQKCWHKIEEIFKIPSGPPYHLKINLLLKTPSPPYPSPPPPPETIPLIFDSFLSSRYLIGMAGPLDNTTYAKEAHMVRWNKPQQVCSLPFISVLFNSAS